MTQVSFGNFFNLNGKTIEGGAGGSGIDTQSLIASLMQAKQGPVTEDQDEIKVNDAQSAALSQFQQLLSNFQSASDALRNPPGVGNSANNAFLFTTGSVTSNTAVAGSTYVGVTTQAGASLQSYTISDITSLATSASQNTGIFTIANADTSIVSASSIAGTAHQFAPGEIDFTDGAKVTLSEGDSLNTVAAKFNAVSTTTGINASVIQIDGTHFQMIFTANQTGTDNNFDLTNASTSTISAGASFLSGAGLATAVSANNADFKINNISIERQSNVISDVISGVTLNLLQETPDSGTQLTVSVNPDTTTVQNSIVGYINAYNAIKTFAAQQTQLKNDGTYASAAVLAGNQTFRGLLANINQQVVSQVSGLSGVNSLGAIGITFTNQPATTGTNATPEVDNILTVDDGLLSSALATNYKAVENVFGMNLTSDNPNLKIFAVNNALKATSFTLTLNPSGNSFTASINGGSAITLTAVPIAGTNNATIGYTLTGPVGSALEGLQLIYGSTATSTADVTITQGVASQTYNTSVAALKSKTGLLPVALQQLQDSDTKLNQDIQTQNTLLNSYQTQLVQEFTALEQAVSSVNSLLNSLAANSVAAQEAANIS